MPPAATPKGKGGGGIGRRLSTLLSPLSTARSSAIKPPWSDGDSSDSSLIKRDDDDDHEEEGDFRDKDSMSSLPRSLTNKRSARTARSSLSSPSRQISVIGGSSSKKKRTKRVGGGSTRIVQSVLSSRKKDKNGNRGRRSGGGGKKRYEDDEDSSSLVSTLSDDSLSASSLDDDESSGYEERYHRHRKSRRHHHRVRDHHDYSRRRYRSHYKKRRHRRKGRSSWSSDADSSLSSSEIGDDNISQVDNEKTASAGRIREKEQAKAMKSSTRRGRLHGDSPNKSIINNDNETDQMMEILHEIIPFYGHGDDQSDAIVRETIERLPDHALELPGPYGNGNTILLLACQAGAYDDLVPLLVARGCDVNAQANDGVACLHYTCYPDSLAPQIAQLLIDNGANVEVTDTIFGCSPLHWAAFSGHVDLCKRLCEAGGNPRKLDKNGCDAIGYSTQSGNEKCVEYLTAFADSMPPIGQSASSIKTNSSASMIAPALSSVPSPRPSQESPRPSHNQNSSPSVKIATATGASVSNGPLTSETFEERMSALQSKVEKQFLNQLSKIEGQIAEQQQQQNAAVVAAASNDVQNAQNDSLVEMTSKVVQLQADIGSKDLEILSLKRDISSLEATLARESSLCTNKTPSAAQTRDVGTFFCDNDTSSIIGICRGNETFVDGDEADMKRIRDEIVMKTKQLDLAQQHCSDLENQLCLIQKELSAARDDQALAERRISSTEDLLAKERVAKDDVMRLLEQTKQGAQVEGEIARSMKEERERDKEMISRLEFELKTTELSKTDEIAVIKSRLDQKEQKLAADDREILRLNEELDDTLRTFEEEKVRYTVAQHEHATEMQRIRSDLMCEKEQLEQELSTRHREEKDRLQRQFNEERLSRMESEVERNDAIEAKEGALQRCALAESKLNEMKDLITEARVLTGVNERLHRALHSEAEKRKTLHNKLEDMKGRIRVYVRIRPLSSSEVDRQCRCALIKEDKRTCVMDADPNKGTAVDAKSWEFDQIFCGSSTGSDGNSQEDVFKDTSLLITSAVDGFNVCIFAYGQTGSGKTYTMFGPGAIGSQIREDGTLDANCGLAPRAAEELFRVLEEKEASCHIDVQVSMFELYNDTIRDLLVSISSRDGAAAASTADGATGTHAQTSLKVKLAKHSETGMVEVEGAVREAATNATELLSLFARGSQFRTTASTDMNADSSRSHLITSIVTTLTNKRTGRKIRGKLTLVDLAGSERVSKSGASGHQLKEAQSINKSLSALGDVISALTSGSRHVPYRNHPLTMLMSDSLGGSAKTLMFVCCSPADYNRSESSNSLDFAKRCKNVTNAVNANGQSASQIRALRVELKRLKSSGRSSMGSGKATRRPGL